MEHPFLIKTDPPPYITDARMAMRMPSFVVFLAATIFACTPILYYGVSHEPSSSNCWLVGGILMISAALRLWFPLGTIGFSWFNMLLGIWVFISPLILGYWDQTAYTVHTMLMGIVIVGMSLASVYGSRFPGTPISTAYEERQGLQHQDYPDIGPDRRWESF
jgi:hypothetical protein